MTDKITIGTVRSRGGLDEDYQETIILMKLGKEPKIGMEMTLKNRLNNKPTQRPIQIMFNKYELKELDRLIDHLKGGKEIFINYQNINNRKRE